MILICLTKTKGYKVLKSLNFKYDKRRINCYLWERNNTVFMAKSVSLRYNMDN